MFGLTYEQSRLMFSVQKLLAERDYANNAGKRKADVKRTWIDNWTESILRYMDAIDGDMEASLASEEELDELFQAELEKSALLSWYYIVVLECLTFKPYSPLGDEENDKKYAKCSFDSKASEEFLKEFFSKHGVVSSYQVERIKWSYDRNERKISNAGAKLAQKVLIVVSASAIGAAAAAIFAPTIAVALFGSQAAGLSGAALTSSCLAMAGGGAIAQGGMGMAAGVAFISGGGALLGTAGGATLMGAMDKMILSSPDYTLSQAAKLETILKEVVLNVQHDMVNAQKVLDSYRVKIKDLNEMITDLELDKDKKDNEIKTLRESLKYLMNAHVEMESTIKKYEEGTDK